MKKLLLFVFIFSSLLASAQQETFESFKWNEVNHPFKNLNKNSTNPNVDENGISWLLDRNDTSITLYENTNNAKIKIRNGQRQKSGYYYYPSSVIVENNKTKAVLIIGSKYINNKSLYDVYIIRYDSLGKVAYLYSEELGLTDSTVKIEQFQTISNKFLFVNSNGDCIWDGKIVANNLGRYYSVISDKKGTIHLISYSQTGIYSFYSDGTFEKRFKNDKVNLLNLNPHSGILRVKINGLVIGLEGKNNRVIDIPNAGLLLKSSRITSYINEFKMEILVSTKGINVSEGNKSVTYLFSGKPEINSDSLYYSIDSQNTQTDSTVVFCLHYSTNSFYDSISYLFTYKRGTLSFHKKYDWKKLGIAYGIHGKTYYVDKNITHMYYLTDEYELYCIKNDSLVTKIPNPTNCEIETLRVADKDYLWYTDDGNIDGSYINENRNDKCSVVRLRHDTYFVRGKVFYDANKNGYQDNSEFGYSKVKLIAQPSGLQLTPDYDGNFAFKGEQGKSYTIEVADSIRFSSIIKNSYHGTIGVKLKEEKPEVNASFWLPRARCFTKLPASFYLQNTGVVPVEKVVIRLVPTKMKLLQNSTLVDTATFTYQNLGVHQSASLAYDIEWPEAELTGQTATLKTITDLYVNGVVASRKIDSVQAIIRCSYDPNDKSVTPAGIGQKLYTLKTSALQYQIRFENTGNDTAYHIVIQDTLNSNLDFSTFEVLGSSHKMNAEISKTGVIGFHFNYINLPDSTTDKKGAQGYVRFSIKPKTTVANNTLVCNKAAIYFDQNKPVITNSTCNLLVDKIPTNPLGLENSENVVENSIYPNPTNDWIFLPKGAEETTIYNTLGNQVLKSTETKLSMAGFEEGIYIAKVRAKNGKVSTHKISVLR